MRISAQPYSVAVLNVIQEVSRRNLGHSKFQVCSPIGLIVHVDPYLPIGMQLIPSRSRVGLKPNWSNFRQLAVIGKKSDTEPNYNDDLVRPDNAVNIGDIVGHYPQITNSFNIFSAFTKKITLDGAVIKGDFNLIQIIGESVYLGDSRIEGQANLVHSCMKTSGDAVD